MSQKSRASPSLWKTKFSQNSQENTCARVSFLIKLQVATSANVSCKISKLIRVATLNKKTVKICPSMVSLTGIINLKEYSAQYSKLIKIQY